MTTTIKDLIDRLSTDYEPDELIAYTIYSKGDVEAVLKDEHNRTDIDADEVWREIAHDFDNGMGDHSELNAVLSELVSYEVDQYEEPKGEK